MIWIHLRPSFQFFNFSCHDLSFSILKRSIYQTSHETTIGDRELRWYLRQNRRAVCHEDVPAARNRNSRESKKKEREREREKEKEGEERAIARRFLCLDSREAPTIRLLIETIPMRTGDWRRPPGPRVFRLKIRTTFSPSEREGKPGTIYDKTRSIRAAFWILNRVFKRGHRAECRHRV